MENDYVLSIDIGKRNLGYCLFNGLNIYFGLFDIEANINSTMIKKFSTPGARVFVLNKWFEGVLKRVNVVEVIVEKQVKFNIVAQQLETCVMSLACMRGIGFKTYDPKNKFVYLRPKFDSSKKEHKKISIEYAKKILLNLGYELDYFESFKKRDDIADAICMGVFSMIDDSKIIKYLLLNDISECSN